jgi:hypothetical protein
MKIYTKVVIDYDGNTIEEESYEYDGPIAKCYETTVEAPEISAKERDLQTLRLRQLRAQEREQLALRPFQLQTLGLIEEDIKTPEIEANLAAKLQEYNEAISREDWGTASRLGTEYEDMVARTKQVRRLTEEERVAGLTPSQLRQEEIRGLQEERQLLALKGELPLTEQFTQQKKSQFEQFKEAQARQGNIITGDTPEEAVAQSSPGIQALRQFRERFGILEEAQRRGEIQSGTANLLALQGGISARQQQQLQQQIAFPGRRAGFLTQLGQAQQPFQFQRGLQFQAGQQTAANRAQLFGDIAGAFGTGTGAFLALR